MVSTSPCPALPTWFAQHPRSVAEWDRRRDAEGVGVQEFAGVLVAGKLGIGEDALPIRRRLGAIIPTPGWCAHHLARATPSGLQGS
jgi:hypothetical protein